MLGQIGAPSGAGSFQYYTTPLSTLNGISVTSGVNGVVGGWRALASGAQLPFDVYGFTISLVGSNNTTRNLTFDIGVDPNGNQSYSQVPFTNLPTMSVAAGVANANTPMYFPFFIKAGSGVAIRGASNSASITGYVTAKFFFGQSSPQLNKVAQYYETVPPLIPGSVGESLDSIVPTVINTKSAWAEIGTTVKNIWYANFNLARAAAAANPAGMLLVDVAYGDDTNKTIILQDRYVTSASSLIQPYLTSILDGYCNIPAGSRIFVRYSSSAITGDYTGFHFTLTGFGG